MDGPPPDDAARVRLVFFDLDGTLVLGQTQRMLLTFLRRRGLVGPAFVVGSLLWFAGYKAGLLRATDDARARAASVLSGRQSAMVEHLMDDFVEEVLSPRLFTPAVSALAGHVARNQRVIILSAALDPLVSALARRLGVTEFLATTLERDEEGVFTGRLLGAGLYGPEKARAAERVMRDAGAAPEECAAYADHESDLRLLESVGHPVAVRPRPGLRRVAEARGWKILF